MWITPHEGSNPSLCAKNKGHSLWVPFIFDTVGRSRTLHCTVQGTAMCRSDTTHYAGYGIRIAVCAFEENHRVIVYQFLSGGGDKKAVSRKCLPLWSLFAFNYFLNTLTRSLQFFFFIANQNSEKPPSPTVAVEPTAMPATAPPEIPPFGISAPHSSHLPSVFSL